MPTASTVYAHRDEQIIRLNLLRALQLHGRLALGCAVAGLLIAMAYAILMWPLYTAKSQIYVQPGQSKVVEQLRNLMVEDSVPGAMNMPVAAMLPLSPCLARVLKGALPLALGGCLLGVLAAIVANRLDPRIYIGADIQAALGFPPIAVLPDFDEVSAGVTKECLMRLAEAIEHVGRKSDLQTCIVTGASHHSGATTVAESVRDALYAAGRPAVLLNATGYLSQDSSDTEASTALLKQVASHTERDEESLVLIDTAPLVLSAETESLARSVDGALLVIQSGVTTRAQMLAAVNTLQRLEVSAVGFVLNRVSVAKADPAFRHSLHEMEKHLRNQGVSSSTWPVRWHGIINENPRKPEYAAKANALPAQSEPAQESADVPTTSSSQARPEPLANAAEACAAEPEQTYCPESAPPRIQAPKLPDWFWEPGTGGTADFARLAAEHAASAEQMPTDAEQRIERLRALFSNVGLANLQRNRGLPQTGEQEPSLTATTAGRISPFVPEPSPAAVPIEKAEEVDVITPVIAKPEIISPKEFVPIKEQKHRSDADSSSAWNDDDIRILPAKRGQYGSR